jgi:uncharacterized protein (DUF305 family)
VSRIWRASPPLARVITAAAAVLLLASGCSAGSEEPNADGPAVASAGQGGANDADRHFVEKLQPHHDQAVEMSKMVLAKKSGVDPEVQEIARQIAEVSETELDEVNAWAVAWGSAAAEGHGAEEDPDHHGGAGGLMTEGQMLLLDQLEGLDAQQVYLDGMVKHHQGAVALTETQVREGTHPGAVALAREILARQRSEITRLQELQEG